MTVGAMPRQSQIVGFVWHVCEVRPVAVVYQEHWHFG